MVKQCTRCQEPKNSDDFNKCSARQDGRSSWCRSCQKEHYELNKETILERQKKYQLLHPEVHDRASTKYYESNKEEVKAKSSLHYWLNRDSIAAATNGNPFVSAKRTEQRFANLDARLKQEQIRRRRRRATKKEQINLKNREWTNKKLKEDPNFKLAHLLRSRLTKAINRRQKTGSAVDDLGCSVAELRIHLESKFQPGMNWENWGHGEGKWNIDHIMPLAAFDLTNRQHLVLACYYLNLRPLWHIENMKKGKKIIAFL